MMLTTRQLNKHNRDDQWYEDHFFNAVKSPAQLIHAIKLHAQALTSQAIKNNTWGKVRVSEVPIFHDISCDFLLFNSFVSNTHSCPVGGVQNFMCEHTLPRGYPGFKGRIDYSVYWDKHNEGAYSCGNGLFKPVRVNTGSGGGGGMSTLGDGRYVQSFGYDFKLFLSDYPAMEKCTEEMIIWDALRGQIVEVVNQLNHFYPAEDYQPIVRNETKESVNV